MEKVRNFLVIFLAGFYFLTVMWWVILLLWFIPLGYFMEISQIYTSGYSQPNVDLSLVGMLSLFISLSMLVPGIRKMYEILPGLFPLVTISYLNALIVNVGAIILNNGFSVQNDMRHMLFIIITIAQLILCRFLMCWYLSKRPIHSLGGGKNA